MGKTTKPVVKEKDKDEVYRTQESEVEKKKKLRKMAR